MPPPRLAPKRGPPGAGGGMCKASAIDAINISQRLAHQPQSEHKRRIELFDTGATLHVTDPSVPGQIKLIVEFDDVDLC